jgi:hypothetical protein
VTGERVKDETVNQSGTFPEEDYLMADALGSCGTGMGVTVNMGDFESARVDVWVTLPCKPDGLDATFKKCKDWTQQKLNDEVLQLVEARKEKKKAKGGS